jgi:para-nitrobenzyl esterase
MNGRVADASARPAPGLPSSGLVVETEFGLVSGSGGPIRVFKGIPYAAPPIGELRWRPPAPPSRWQGVRHMGAFGADCPQAPSARTRAPGMDEDCLTLNIWAPALEPGETRPVMVWLYGGSYVAGSASDPRCDGESFARKGVVLVAINYRVGLFGFFAHSALTRESEHGSSGNYGLLDTIAALAWVQRNIAGFGGDPNRITLFGVSAGAASISLLLTSPLARGLFAQTIQQSPGAFRPLASLAQAEQAGLQLGNDIATLRRMSSEEVLRATPLFVPKMRGLTTPRVLRPIRDGWVIRHGEREAYAAGEILKVPTIVGTNADEGSKLTAGWTVNSVGELDLLLTETFGGAAEPAKALYAPTGASGVRDCVAALFADTQFNSGARGVARGLAAIGAPVYRYLFVRSRPGRGHPNHGDEVPYVFASLNEAALIEPAPFDAVDEALADAMQDAWIRFAVTGDPNGGSLAPWPKTASGDEYLILDEQIGVGRDWRRQHLDFIDAHFDEVTRAGIARTLP